MIFSMFKIVHLVALVFGAVASLGNVYILLARGPHDLPAPGFVNSLRKWYRLTALGAIVTLWISGMALMVIRYGWGTGFAFNAKMFLATLLLALIGFINFMAPRWAGRGGPPAYVSGLHLTGAACLLLTVGFAVGAFA